MPEPLSKIAIDKPIKTDEIIIPTTAYPVKIEKEFPKTNRFKSSVLGREFDDAQEMAKEEDEYWNANKITKKVWEMSTNLLTPTNVKVG